MYTRVNKRQLKEKVDAEDEEDESEVTDEVDDNNSRGIGFQICFLTFTLIYYIRSSIDSIGSYMSKVAEIVFVLST